MEEEKTYINDSDKKKCTGCTACKNICPQKAIDMLEDEEGFLYPKIDKSKCIGCHLCEKVCPIIKKIPIVEPKAYIYYTKSNTDLMKASSGGAFGDIVKTYFNDGQAYIYGCTFNEKNKAVHIGVKGIDDIDKFKKSKYVQSNLLNTFSEVKNYLKKEERVVFSGTPCQISGLKSFLNKEYDNLLLIDLICHGVPSQKLLDLYLLEEERQNKSKVKYISFRKKVKDKNGQYNSKNVELLFENGITKIKNIKECSYLVGFQNRLFYRPSCYNCKFSKINRLSDLTISDAWGVEKIDPQLDVHKGVSVIIANTEKGKNIVNKMDGVKIEIPIKFVINENESYTKTTKLHKKRADFFKDLNDNNFGYLVNKYTRNNILKRGILYIKRRITSIKKY